MFDKYLIVRGNMPLLSVNVDKLELNGDRKIAALEPLKWSRANFTGQVTSILSTIVASCCTTCACRSYEGDAWGTFVGSVGRHTHIFLSCTSLRVIKILANLDSRKLQLNTILILAANIIPVVSPLIRHLCDENCIYCYLTESNGKRITQMLSVVGHVLMELSKMRIP